MNHDSGMKPDDHERGETADTIQSRKLALSTHGPASIATATLIHPPATPSRTLPSGEASVGPFTHPATPSRPRRCALPPIPAPRRGSIPTSPRPQRRTHHGQHRGDAGVVDNLTARGELLGEKCCLLRDAGAEHEDVEASSLLPEQVATSVKRRVASPARRTARRGNRPNPRPHAVAGSLMA